MQNWGYKAKSGIATAQRRTATSVNVKVISAYNMEDSQAQRNVALTNNNLNKKLSYRRETARQLHMSI